MFACNKTTNDYIISKTCVFQETREAVETTNVETNELSNVTVTDSDKKGWSKIKMRLANEFSNHGNPLYAMISVPKSSVKYVLGKINEKMPPGKIRTTLKKIGPSFLKFNRKHGTSDHKVQSKAGHKNNKNTKRNVHSPKKSIKSNVKQVLKNVYQSIKNGGKNFNLNNLLKTKLGKRVSKLIMKLENTNYWKTLEARWKKEQEKMMMILKSEGNMENQEKGGTPVE